MRDGVALVADVYEPEADGKFPVLLARTPYGRASESATAFKLATHGYIVVVQDTRGRYDSEGEFYPFKYEIQDGYDTVEWVALLTHSNGRVGMFGASYVGATQWLAAVARPPHLAAIFPQLTSSEYYEGWTYQSGALMQWFANSWATVLAIDTLRHRAEDEVDTKSWVWHLPLEKYRLLEPPGVSELAPYLNDWLVHDRDDSYWRAWKVSNHYGKMNVKALHLGGWYDIFLKGTLTNFMGMRASSPAGSCQRLLIDARSHADNLTGGRVGDVIFGSDAIVDKDVVALKWFDYALNGVQNEYAGGAPIRLFVMGANVWRNEQEFPLARTRYTTYYLDHGSLGTEAPGDESPDTYIYDPKSPVPTRGGRLCCENEQLEPGPFDQRPNENRPDVLVFSTPPLPNDVEVTGFIRAKIYAASSARDTDFSAMLTDVEPSGYSRLLTDGIVRARYRNTTAKAELIEPGKIYAYDIDLWATSNVFKAGHRIRLTVSSSNFPRFNRNLNTGAPIFSSRRMLTARQKIYHDRQHPSVLVLPVIPR
jgi:putative CocE/NonD family hydrolase